VARRYVKNLNIQIVQLSDEWALRNLHICVRNMKELPGFTRDFVTMLIEDAKTN